MSTHEYWCVSFPVKSNNRFSYEKARAGDESQARELARKYSQVHGHATITNLQGHVATYVNGEELRVAPLKPICMIPDCGCAGDAHH